MPSLTQMAQAGSGEAGLHDTPPTSRGGLKSAEDAFASWPSKDGPPPVFGRLCRLAGQDKLTTERVVQFGR